MNDSKNIRFFDSRERYRMFVSTCTEKLEVARRVGRELEVIEPGVRSLNIFDAGLGEGTVLDQVLRDLHVRFPHVPIVVVGKEISLEDVRQSLARMADRFIEHPELVFIVTNMLYREAPSLIPYRSAQRDRLIWREIELEGETSHGFGEQIRACNETLAEDWQVTTSEKTGNPVYAAPAVTVVYRKDRNFLLRPLLPNPNDGARPYDLVIASQPYRARTPADIKVRNVIAPLAKSLAPGGRLITVQSSGRDPGMEIVNRIWPGEKPFVTPRSVLIEEARRQLTDDTQLVFHNVPDDEAIFSYRLHTMAADLENNIGTSVSLAAWNAAVYVAQMDEARVEEALRAGEWRQPVREVLEAHNGLWFHDESFVISRKKA